MVGFRSAGPSGTLSKAQNIITKPYQGIDPIVPTPYAPPAAPPIDYSDLDHDDGGNNSNQTSLDYINNYNNQIDANNQFGPGGMMQANIDNPVANPTDFYGNPIKKEVHGPTFDPSILVPGGSFMALNKPSIPTSGYGTPGTYSSISGGKFNADGQAINPITGQPLQEYATVGAFKDSVLSNPLGETSQGQLKDMEYAKQKSEYATLKEGGTDVMGNPVSTGLSKEAEQKVAQALGEDMGFPSYTVAPGTATNQAIISGKVVPGSQHSKTNTFTNKTGAGSLTKGPPPGHPETHGGGEHESNEDHSEHQDESGGWDDYSFNTGGLVPELGIPKRDRDISHPMMQDPLVGFI